MDLNPKRVDPRGIGWTGERCVPWTGDVQVAYEHYLRYLFVLTIAKGQRVLDLASGEGYGAALLASMADFVLGVDIDPASVLHASTKYEAANLSFRSMDMLDLSGLEDASFDLITCFEAIEHVENHQVLLDGVIRLLKPGGIFAVSTPDRLAHAHAQEVENPFHVHELSHDELTALLGPRFATIRVWGENVSVGATLMPLDLGTGTGGLVAMSRDESGWAIAPRFDPTYVVALCSDGQLPTLPDYFNLLDTGLELVRNALQDRDALDQIQIDLLGELRRVQTRLAQHEGLIDRLEARASTLVQENQRAYLASETTQQGLARLAVENAALESAVAAVYSSREYRLGFSLWRLLNTSFPVGSRRRHLLAEARRFTRLTRDVAPGNTVGTLPHTRDEVTSHSLDFGPLPVLQSSESPTVTIVIPVYNGWQMTLDCLWSIAGSIPAIDFEVIVVDDASTDETAELLAQILGIRLIKSNRNAGFLTSANLGAASARGRLIVFVNNDVHVLPGWLDALVATADSEGDVGIVGGKVLDLKARLQEAGGIIFRDGSAWHYGRGADPDDPSFNFPREIDYCSGACMLVSRGFWELAGGFDPRYAPAYYEDADLAFTARELGYRVLYEPLSRVVHQEGSSYGTDDSPRKRELMQRNQKIFQNKWSVELTAQHARNEERVRSASRRSRAGHALVADYQTPAFDQDAGSLRMYELLKMLRELGYAVTFVPQNGGDTHRYTAALEELGIEVLHGRIDVPYLIKQISADLKLALLARPTVAWGLIPPLREFAPNARIIYDTVDLHFVRERRRSELENVAEDAAEALRMSEYFRELEVWLANSCDATFAVSEIERELILREAPDATVHVIPTIHRLHHPGAKFDDRKGLLFVGSFNHPPNRDAVTWLATQILPRLRERNVDAPLYIVGSSPTEEVIALADTGIEVLGWVADLESLYARCRVFVAPMRFGAGIRGKIGESAAYGLPVVSTSLGAEGLPLLHEESILLAETADDFAAAVVRLYEDERLWTEIARSARRAVALEQSPTVVRRKLGEALASLEDKKLPTIERRDDVLPASRDS